MIINWLPALAFFSAYTVACVLGSLILICRIEPYLSATEQFTGVSIPVLSNAEQMTFLFILIGGPFSLFVGYRIALYLVKRLNLHINFGDIDIGQSAVIANILFYSLLCLAIKGLYENNAFTNILAWGDYDQWIAARWQIYSGLSFFEFVNVYNILPLAAALILLTKPLSLSPIIRFTYWLPLLLTLGIDLLLYQKKPALFTIMACTGALWISNVLRNPQRQSRHFIKILSIIASVILCYSLVVLAPYIIPYKNNVVTLDKNMLADKLGFNSPTSTEIVLSDSLKKSNGASKISHVEYTVLSLIMRTPIPALFYPIVFPKKEPYFAIDLGQDVLGFGAMPSDNRIIWNTMYPHMAGDSAAPMNFVFYSQGGLSVVFIGMGLVGAALGLCWSIILGSTGGHNTRSLAGIFILLCSIHFSIASMRHTILVSYGYMWPILFIGLLYVATQFTQRKNYLTKELIN